MLQQLLNRPSLGQGEELKLHRRLARAGDEGVDGSGAGDFGDALAGETTSFLGHLILLN